MARSNEKGFALVVFIFIIPFLVLITSTTLIHGGGAVYNPGGKVIDVAPGDNFLLRYRLYWDEPYSGYYLVNIFWLNYENKPGENLTFIRGIAYFDNDGDNLPDPGVAMIENLVTLEATSSGADTMYLLTVACSGGNENDGIFNVDIWIAAAGAEGTPHALKDNHPIWHSMDSIILAESEMTSVPAGMVTIRVIGRGADVTKYHEFPVALVLISVVLALAAGFTIYWFKFGRRFSRRARPRLSVF